ncbi:hypothetical protein HHK36_019467 [Tetracentron sinense]|uniref:Annexin n=1 Tax=Tetracentron sinense TaxID=13715 RepID=A0A834YTX6_TETSI|nr:hypothetical protein HHK36_019467 [Tetracentron sinense]
MAITTTTPNPNSTTHDYAKHCRAIHDAQGELNQLVRVLARRTHLERRHVRETYIAMYGEELVDHLQKIQTTNKRNELSALLILSMLEPHERDAAIARDALEHGDANHRALVEIYVGRKSSHLLLIKQAYQAKFKRQLEQHIISSEPLHPYQRILVALAASHKSHHVDASQHIAKCDARRLYETGEGRLGAIEESVVLELLSKRSIPQLKLTFSSYKHIYGHDYTKSLKKVTSGEFADALRVVVKCMYTPPKYYAKVLHASIKGTTTEKCDLLRVIVSRAEVDMDEIQSVFKKKYGKELRDAISESIPNGDYRDFLVALVTNNPSS